MNSILILGAGRCSGAMIDYVLQEAVQHGWNVTVADTDMDLAIQKVNNRPNGRGTWLDVTKVNDRRDLIARTDLVVSLLPAHLHLEVAHDCIKLNKQFITSSHVSHELYRLGDEARNRELIYTGQKGLDPGASHMKTRHYLDQLRSKGATITSFRSYIGGLVAPESLENNPWKYKFTWNPRNSVLMGQGTSQYLDKKKLKYIPYTNLFESYKTVTINGVGDFEMYPNRDSLLHRGAYGLKEVPSVMRGTLRYPGFCDGWNALVKLGLTDGSYPILDAKNMSFHEWIDAYVCEEPGSSLKDRTASKLGKYASTKVMKQLEWLGLFRKKKINVRTATPALLLEKLLVDKWQLKPKDKDLVINQLEFEYELEGQQKKLTSTLVLKGEDAQNTAIAKFIGLPLAIFIKKFMLGEITDTGINVSMKKEVYEPVLEELKEYGISYIEKESLIS